MYLIPDVEFFCIHAFVDDNSRKISTQPDRERVEIFDWTRLHRLEEGEPVPPAHQFVEWINAGGFYLDQQVLKQIQGSMLGAAQI